ncbi:MAG: aminotransferase class IV [Chloroflexi bacterium]|nr:aminotransferase class IV [Chloroflexota bacterium]
MTGIPDTVAYFNGEWVPRSTIKIDPLDRGFYVADAIYDIGRTFNGKSFKMREHIERLYRSLKFVRIDPRLSEEEKFDISEECIRRNEHLRKDVGDWHIWQAVTRGVAGFRVYGVPPTVLIQCVPVPFASYAPYYQNGAHIVVPRTRSYSSQSLDPKIKHYSRMNFNLAELEAHDIDPESWPVLTDENGNLTEGTGYNFFIVTDGVLRTPGDNTLLQGITRMAVIELAERLNIPFSEEDLQPYDLYTADEAFLCNTPICVLPVTKADKRVIGDGKPGPVTQQLLAAWSDWVGLDVVDQMERYAADQTTIMS